MNLLGEEARKEEKLGEQSLELQVNPDTPPAFLWHTATDPTVPVENSLLFFPGPAPPPCAGGASYLSGGRPRPGAGKRGDKTGRRIWRSEAVPELDRSGGRVDERNITAQTERGGCKIMKRMMEQPLFDVGESRKKRRSVFSGESMWNRTHPGYQYPTLVLKTRGHTSTHLLRRQYSKSRSESQGHPSLEFLSDFFGRFFPASSQAL